MSFRKRRLPGKVAHALIPALKKQRQGDLCEFEVSLVYKANSKTVRTVTQRDPVLRQRRENVD